eukprot:12882202-Alexandrium_andersonii.AAC.1
MPSHWPEADVAGRHGARRRVKAIDDLLSCATRKACTGQPLPCTGLQPVSYTHLTLPTICSV